MSASSTTAEFLSSTRDASQSPESNRRAKRAEGCISPRFQAQSRLRRRESLLGRGICHSCLRADATLGLFDVLPNVLAAVGLSLRSVGNSVAWRCAGRGASGDHDQTKPLTPQPPSKTSWADLRLRRAAGARTPLIPARYRPSRWPGFGQHGWERHTRIALALAISLGSKSMALGCASQVLVAPGPLRSS